MSLNAQNGGFFTYNSVDDRGSEWGTMPVLPTSAGLTSDYGADAPLGSGLLILGVLALGYTLIVTFLYRNKSSKMTSL